MKVHILLAFSWGCTGVWEGGFLLLGDGVFGDLEWKSAGSCFGALGLRVDRPEREREGLYKVSQYGVDVGGHWKLEEEATVEFLV